MWVCILDDCIFPALGSMIFPTGAKRDFYNEFLENCLEGFKDYGGIYIN